MKRLLHVSQDLWLPANTVTSTGVVYGGKGMGKSNLLSVMLEELHRAHLKFSAIDPMGVLWGLRFDVSGKGPGIEVLILGGIHGDIPIEPTAGAIVADLVVDEDVSVIIDISRRKDGSMWSIAERIRFVTDYSKRLYMRQGEKRRPILQLIDEGARFAPQTIRKDDEHSAACMGAIAVLVEEGRNVGIGCWLFTQRSARLNKDVAELADSMIALRTGGPNSRRAVLDWMGEYVEKERLKKFDEELRRLPVGTGLVISSGWLEVEKIVAFRARSTFDSSATPKPGQRLKRVSGGAKPDLSKYAERMKETIERATANDPRILQKKIKELEAQLSSKERTQSFDAARTIDELKKRIGELEARKPEVRDRPILKDGQIKRVEAVIEKGVRFLEGSEKAMRNGMDRGEKIGDAIRIAIGDLGKTLTLVANAGQPTSGWKIVEPPAKPMPSLPAARPPRALVPHTVVTRHAGAPDGDSGELRDGGERKVLTAIAQHTEGVTSEELSVLVGYKKTSRDTFLSRLVGRGFITRDAGKWLAYEKGRAALGPDFEPLPTGAALLDYWRAKLPDGERGVLDIAVDRYPGAVAKEHLVEALPQYKKTSRDTYISRLRAKHLLTEPGRGEIRASDTLFDNLNRSAT